MLIAGHGRLEAAKARGHQELILIEAGKRQIEAGALQIAKFKPQ
jgi:ParB-like chromosome segregation protein Spo0J